MLRAVVARWARPCIGVAEFDRERGVGDEGQAVQHPAQLASANLPGYQFESPGEQDSTWDSPVPWRGQNVVSPIALSAELLPRSTWCVRLWLGLMCDSCWVWWVRKQYHFWLAEARFDAWAVPAGGP
jgi:hypothetical protein